MDEGHLLAAWAAAGAEERSAAIVLVLTALLLALGGRAPLAALLALLGRGRTPR